MIHANDICGQTRSSFSLITVTIYLRIDDKRFFGFYTHEILLIPLKNLNTCILIIVINNDIATFIFVESGT